MRDIAVVVLLVLVLCVTLLTAGCSSEHPQYEMSYAERTFVIFDNRNARIWAIAYVKGTKNYSRLEVTGKNMVDLDKD